MCWLVGCFQFAYRNKVMGTWHNMVVFLLGDQLWVWYVCTKYIYWMLLRRYYNGSFPYCVLTLVMCLSNSDKEFVWSGHIHLIQWSCWILVKIKLVFWQGGFKTDKSFSANVNRKQQDRQHTYNVTQRRVRATIVAVEKHWVLQNLCVCICSFWYPTCDVHESYRHLWPAPFYNIFPRFLISSTIFEKKITEHKMYFDFLTIFVWNISYSTKKWARYY
jgi:hypothetical protein